MYRVDDDVIAAFEDQDDGLQKAVWTASSVTTRACERGRMVRLPLARSSTCVDRPVTRRVTHLMGEPLPGGLISSWMNPMGDVDRGRTFSVSVAARTFLPAATVGHHLVVRPALMAAAVIVRHASRSVTLVHAPLGSGSWANRPSSDDSGIGASVKASLTSAHRKRIVYTWRSAGRRASTVSPTQRSNMLGTTRSGWSSTSTTGKIDSWSPAPTNAASFLELVAVPAGDPTQIIHADRLRPKFYDYLE